MAFPIHKDQNAPRRTLLFLTCKNASAFFLFLIRLIDTYISSFFHTDDLLCFLGTVRKYPVRLKPHTCSAGRT